MQRSIIILGIWPIFYIQFLKIKGESSLKKNLIIIAVLLVFSFVWFFQDNEYKTLEDLERLFMEHDISYIPKPVETDHILDIAKEQRIYENRK